MQRLDAPCEVHGQSLDEQRVGGSGGCRSLAHLSQVHSDSHLGKLGLVMDTRDSWLDFAPWLGLPAPRIFQATFAGPNAGTLSIVIDHPSLAAFAANNAKQGADSEWQSWIDELNKAGIRQLVSNSLVVEVTP